MQKEKLTVNNVKSDLQLKTKYDIKNLVLFSIYEKMSKYCIIQKYAI